MSRVALHTLSTTELIALAEDEADLARADDAPLLLALAERLREPASLAPIIDQRHTRKPSFYIRLKHRL